VGERAKKWCPALAVFAVLAGCGGGGGGNSTPAVPPLRALPIVNQTPAFERLGTGPLVVVLAMDQQQTLHNAPTTDGIVTRLLNAGYSVLSLDLPCHGADADPGVQPLDCWALRIGAGDKDIFLRFCAGLNRVLDDSQVTQAAILGVSRGGYVAATCAAYESRFSDVVLEIPVTDLNYLTEFQSQPVDQSIFGTAQYVPYLADRAALVRIGKDDMRVGTSLAEKFAHDIGATFELTAAVGHAVAEDGSTVTWLQAHPF
jgi:hypothetical protein